MKKTYSFPTLELESVTLKDVMCISGGMTTDSIEMIDVELTFE